MGMEDEEVVVAYEYCPNCGARVVEKGAER